MLSPPYSISSYSDSGSPRPQRQLIQIVKHGLPGTIDKVPRQRVRVSHQKVRTGCLRCKRRRVKCDESQPQCLRCLRANQSCPGYQQPVTRIFGLTTLEGFNTDFEKLCFDSFFAGGSARLAHFKPTSTPFWISILPQLCQVYLPLRHAAISIAYINEPFYNPTLGPAARSRGPVDTLTVVMSHFNKALRIFNQDIDRLSIEAKVSCCIVFTALTIYMYRVGAVSSHASAASYFLRHHEAVEGYGQALNQVLAPVIRRLVIDACTFSGGMSGCQEGDANPYEENMYELLQIPAAFDTYQDAYDSLCNVLKYAIATSVGHIEHDSRIYLHIQSALRRFDIVLGGSAIESCAGKHLSTEQIDFHRKDLLLQHRVAHLISCLRPGMLECSYRAFTPEFQAILNQIKELIDVELQDPWRITLGWIPPLFLVATKCRISTLRREALHLMHQLRRVERGWTSCVAYALAKFVIDQEESTWPHDSATATYMEYVHLLSVRSNHDEQLATIKYLLQRDQTSLATFSAQLPMKALSKSLTGDPAINVPDPVLQAFGYTGTIMFSPRAECHCHDGGGLVRYMGKVTAAGKEEVVVWQAGMATSKAVKKKNKNSTTELTGRE